MGIVITSSNDRKKERSRSLGYSQWNIYTGGLQSTSWEMREMRWGEK